jgi:hypothetical protein
MRLSCRHTVLQRQVYRPKVRSISASTMPSAAGRINPTPAVEKSRTVHLIRWSGPRSIAPVLASRYRAVALRSIPRYIGPASRGGRQQPDDGWPPEQAATLSHATPVPGYITPLYPTADAVQPVSARRRRPRGAVIHWRTFVVCGVDGSISTRHRIPVARLGSN